MNRVIIYAALLATSLLLSWFDSILGTNILSWMFVCAISWAVASYVTDKW